MSTNLFFYQRIEKLLDLSRSCKELLQRKVADERQLDDDCTFRFQAENPEICSDCSRFANSESTVSDLLAKCSKTVLF